MRTFKIEVIHVPSYIATRCISEIPHKLEVAAKDSFDAIVNFLLQVTKNMGQLVHEIASYLQGPSFLIRDNHIELGKYTMFMRPNAQKTGTIVTVKDRFGITVPNLGLLIGREKDYNQLKYM